MLFACLQLSITLEKRKESSSWKYVLIAFDIGFLKYVKKYVKSKNINFIEAFVSIEHDLISLLESMSR